MDAERKIILLRHAESPHGGKDFERGLTSTGSKQAADLGRYLLPHLKSSFAQTRWYVSSANRTKMTLAAMMGVFSDSDKSLDTNQLDICFEDDLYLAESQFAENLIYQTDPQVKCVVVLAHNPGISNLVSELSNEYVGFRPGEGALLTLNGAWSDASSKSSLEAYFAQN